MGTTVEKLSAAIASKQNIYDAISSKGGQITSETPFVSYGEIIQQLPTGSGGRGVVSNNYNTQVVDGCTYSNEYVATYDRNVSFLDCVVRNYNAVYDEYSSVGTGQISVSLVSCTATNLGIVNWTVANLNMVQVSANSINLQLVNYNQISSASVKHVTMMMSNCFVQDMYVAANMYAVIQDCEISNMGMSCYAASRTINISNTTIGIFTTDSQTSQVSFSGGMLLRNDDMQDATSISANACKFVLSSDRNISALSSVSLNSCSCFLDADIDNLSINSGYTNKNSSSVIATGHIYGGYIQGGLFDRPTDYRPEKLIFNSCCFCNDIIVGMDNAVFNSDSFVRFDNVSRISSYISNVVVSMSIDTQLPTIIKGLTSGGNIVIKNAPAYLSGINADYIDIKNDANISWSFYPDSDFTTDTFYNSSSVILQGCEVSSVLLIGDDVNCNNISFVSLSTYLLSEFNTSMCSNINITSGNIDNVVFVCSGSVYLLDVEGSNCSITQMFGNYPHCILDNCNYVNLDAGYIVVSMYGSGNYGSYTSVVGIPKSMISGCTIDYLSMAGISGGADNSMVDCLVTSMITPSGSDDPYGNYVISNTSISYLECRTTGDSTTALISANNCTIGSLQVESGCAIYIDGNIITGPFSS